MALWLVPGLCAGTVFGFLFGRAYERFHRDALDAAAEAEARRHRDI